MTNPWFRMYSEFATDPVVQLLSFNDQRHYVVILCLKCQGVLDRKLSQENRNRIICKGLGLDQATSEEVKRRLVDVGFIDNNWQPTSWDRRQFKSDNSSERVRKYRENKEDDNVSETLNVTFPSVSVSVLLSSNDFNNVSPEIWAEFEQHRKEIRKPLTDLSRKKNLTVLNKLTLEQQRKSVDNTIANRWTGLFPEKRQLSQPTKLQRAAQAMKDAMGGSNARLISIPK